jgi:hypothetical protein
MDAVGTAHHDGVLELKGLLLQDNQEPIQVFDEDVRGLLEQYRKGVSRTSDEVIPMWMYRPSSPTFSVTDVKKAMTSCLVVLSISSILSTSNPALFLIFQVKPRDQAQLRHCLAGKDFNISHVRYLFSGVQMAVIRSLEYLGIKLVLLLYIQFFMKTGFPS